MAPSQFAVEAHLPMVRAIANSIKQGLPGCFELDDLVSTGVLALYESFDRYDNRDGVQFSTFARYRVRGAILDSVRADYRHSHRHAELTEAIEGPSFEEALTDQVEARRRIAVLPVGEREVIERRYYSGDKVVDISSRMRQTRQSVWKQERSALGRMRAA